jgi:uncharacterized protein YecE (DUF72 family)
MKKIYIGTSGYSYNDWKTVFYPPKTPQTDYLKYYSRSFNFVELNFSYYQIIKKHTLSDMVSKVPEDFTFTIKAHQNLTHRRMDSWRKEALDFADCLSVLMEKGQLGGILLQFPFSFHYTPVNRIYLSKLCDSLRDLPLFIEFRNGEWHREKVLTEMESRNIGVVSTDMPSLKNLADNSIYKTSEDLYIRMHGRNSKNWWNGDNTSRYDYLYSEMELDNKFSNLTDLIDQSKRIFIAFNNHYKGQAIQNAKQIQKLLKQKG